MKNRLALRIHLFLFGLLSSACTVDLDQHAFKSYVVEHQWKYGKGHHIGDWLDFNGGYKIKSDTIFRGDSAVALVKKIEKGMSGVDDKMLVISIVGEDEGVYYSK